MGAAIFTFAGLAFLYGICASLFVSGALWACKYPRPWQFFALLGVTFSFVFLTQHPFPDPGSLNCPVASAEPQLRLFRFMDTFWRLEQRESGLMAYLRNKELMATAANFLVCAGIGFALVRHIEAWPRIILFGVTLTVAVELTQLTGVWGYFPCAYRQFNVDDLMLNILGVLSGALIAKWR